MEVHLTPKWPVLVHWDCLCGKVLLSAQEQGSQLGLCFVLSSLIQSSLWESEEVKLMISNSTKLYSFAHLFHSSPQSSGSGLSCGFIK